MQFADGDVVVRTFEPADRDSLVLLGNDPRVSRFLMNRFPCPYRPADADAWLAHVAGETRPCNFAVEWRGDLAGGIGLDPLDDIHAGTVELGYWLGVPYWGKGIAARAVGLLVPYAFDELCFVRIQAKVFAENTASMRVLQKCGFVREGVMRRHMRKHGVLSDAVLYSLVKGDARDAHG